MSHSLSDLGWGPFFARQLGAREPGVPARLAVVRQRKQSLLGHPKLQQAELTGRLHREVGRSLRRPAVGDWVVVDNKRIVRILERRTALVRRAAGHGRVTAQVVAANLDRVFVVTSLNDEFNPRRVERYLTAVWDSGAEPVIILSKADLCDDPAPYLAQLGEIGADVPIETVSAQVDGGLKPIEPYLDAGVTTALVGSSGVGKSTIVNWLLGVEVQRTGEIRADDDRGRHVTSHRELFVLPRGGLCIDTPGMRELGLLDAEAGLDEAFPDIAELSRHCRFRDCAHGGEPGCAVEGEVDEDRLDSFRKLAQEQADAAAKRRLER